MRVLVRVCKHYMQRCVSAQLYHHVFELTYENLVPVHRMSYFPLSSVLDD